jgi:hypothetical protein
VTSAPPVPPGAVVVDPHEAPAAAEVVTLEPPLAGEDAVVGEDELELLAAHPATRKPAANVTVASRSMRFT